MEDVKFPRAPIAAVEGPHGAFGFPILLDDQVLGVIEFFSHEISQPDEAPDDDRDLRRSLRQAVAPSALNQRLARIGFPDPTACDP